MAKFKVGQRYSANRDGQSVGGWPVGLVVDLDVELAMWVLRDSPGTLTPYVEATPEAEPAPGPETPVEEPARDATPAKDRMHRGGRRRAAS